MSKRNRGYKCKVCNEFFELKKEDRYDVTKLPAGGTFGTLFSNPVAYDAFDCPYCGCQNIVNVRETHTSVPEPEEGDTE